MSAALEQAAFEACVDQGFTVHTGELGRVELTLVNVREREHRRSRSFSLLFRGQSGRCFSHATYRVESAAMGAFDLFLGPVQTESDDGIYYEAVFNRLIDPAHGSKP